MPGPYGTIIADPPWAYAQTSGHGRLKGYSDQHYNPLTTDDLCGLPVRDLATPDAVLLLWVTMPFLPDGLRVVDAWGFDYVTALTWVKADPNSGQLGYGVGYWFRGATELVLVGKRDRSYRSQYLGLLGDEDPAGAPEILVFPGFRHSRKPDSLHIVAESTYPGPYAELFARRTRPGWDCYGNELSGPYGGDIRDTVLAGVQ